MIERGDDLIERLRSGVGDDSANELLRLMFAGYPIGNVVRLTRSEEPVAVKSGAWIISELGHRSAVMMDEVAWLLGHPLREARFWAVDAVLAGTTVDDGETIAKAVALVSDQDEAVRWKALQLLARAPQANLVVSSPYLRDSHLLELVTWLTNIRADPVSLQDTASRLRNADRLTRMVALAAAARLAPLSMSPLEQAMDSEDQEVSSFAKEELRRYRGH